VNTPANVLNWFPFWPMKSDDIRNFLEFPQHKPRFSAALSHRKQAHRTFYITNKNNRQGLEKANQAMV